MQTCTRPPYHTLLLSNANLQIRKKYGRRLGLGSGSFLANLAFIKTRRVYTCLRKRTSDSSVKIFDKEIATPACEFCQEIRYTPSVDGRLTWLLLFRHRLKVLFDLETRRALLLDNG